VRKSKLELYEDILQALVDKYMTVDSMAFECKMDCVAVDRRLKFLIKNGLVKENRCNAKNLYSLTTRGIAICKTLDITRRLEKMKTTIKILDEALHALPVLPEQDDTEPRRASRNEGY
jgi:predicted transcriptional regulator